MKGVRLHQVVMAITAAVWGVLSLLENQHSPWHLELPGLEVECVENKQDASMVALKESFIFYSCKIDMADDQAQGLIVWVVVLYSHLHT